MEHILQLPISQSVPVRDLQYKYLKESKAQEDKTTGITYIHFPSTSFLPLNVGSQIASDHTMRYQGGYSISIFISTNLFKKQI
jgi:hypothetical protein